MSDARPTILPDFHKQVLAVQRVEKQLLDVTGALEAVDQVHVEDPLAVDLIDDTVTASLPLDLLARLREVQETQE